MREEFLPAIQALQQDLADLERKVSETKNTINRLCELAGEQPLFTDVGGTSAQPALTSIQADSFYGKVIVTAAREYLEMRRGANLGPATPREIYEALKKGGFTFDTRIEANAITGIRNTLRKASQIFHRLPGGEYGLLKWYPRAKQPKDTADDEEGDRSSARSEPKAKRRRKSNAARRQHKRKAATDDESATALELRKPRAPADQATLGSVPKTPKGKEEPHAAHEPDIGSPVTGDEAA